MHDPVGCLRTLAGMAGVQLQAREFFDWPGIECGLGLLLPADYKLLSEHLPPGWFRKFARLERPEKGDGQEGGCFPDSFSSEEMAAMREWRDELEIPYPIYPEPGGLLCWGHIWPGGHAFWLTEPAQAPETWPVIIASQGYERWDRFDGPACDFLVEVTTGRYDATKFIEGPIRVIRYESGEHKTGNPIILATRPVFEPDLRPPEG